MKNIFIVPKLFFLMTFLLGAVSAEAKPCKDGDSKVDDSACVSECSKVEDPDNYRGAQAMECVKGKWKIQGYGLCDCPDKKPSKRKKGAAHHEDTEEE